MVDVAKSTLQQSPHKKILHVYKSVDLHFDIKKNILVCLLMDSIIWLINNNFKNLISVFL